MILPNAFELLVIADCPLLFLIAIGFASSTAIAINLRMISYIIIARNNPLSTLGQLHPERKDIYT